MKPSQTCRCESRPPMNAAPVGFVECQKILKIIEPVGPEEEPVGLDQGSEQCFSLSLSTRAVQRFCHAADDGVIGLQLRTIIFQAKIDRGIVAARYGASVENAAILAA